MTTPEIPPAPQDPKPPEDEAVRPETATPAATPDPPPATATPEPSSPSPAASLDRGEGVASAGRKGMHPAVRWLLLIPLWLYLINFLLVPLLGKSSEDEVVLYRFTKAIYLWPIIVVGIGGGWLVDLEVSPTLISWCFNITVFVVFGAMMYDLPRNRFFVVVLSVCVVGLGLWLIQTKTETLAPLTWIHEFFVNMEPKFDVGGARVLSWLLIPLVLHAIIHARIDGKVRITYNEIEFHKFGDVSDSITRFGKRIKLRVADYLEVVPGLGGGSLIIMNDEGDVIERVSDLVCIVPRWPRISRILETWQTRELQDPAAKIVQT
jgi:hypothetical protein